MNRGREALVGAVVLLGIAVGVAGTIWLKDGWGTEGRPIRTAATSVGQLAGGASVKFRGVNVGKVETVSVAPTGDAVLVTMTVNPDLVLPDAAAVLLSPESMFGDWQAEIVSRADFPRMVFLDYPDDDVLPAAVLPDMSRLTAAADEIAGNLATISERFQIAFTEETAQNVARAIANIEDLSNGLSEVVSQQAQRFNQLADGFDESARELGAAARAARGSFERVDGIVAALDVETLMEDAGAAAANLRDLTAHLDASLEDFRGAARRADSTFARLDRLMLTAEEGDGSVARLLSNPALADEAFAAVAEMRALLKDIQENPGRYLRFSVF